MALTPGEIKQIARAVADELANDETFKAAISGAVVDEARGRRRYPPRGPREVPKLSPSFRPSGVEPPE